MAPIAITQKGPVIEPLIITALVAKLTFWVTGLQSIISKLAKLN